MKIDCKYCIGTGEYPQFSGKPCRVCRGEGHSIFTVVPIEEVFIPSTFGSQHACIECPSCDKVWEMEDCCELDSNSFYEELHQCTCGAIFKIDGYWDSYYAMSANIIEQAGGKL